MREKKTPQVGDNVYCFKLFGEGDHFMQWPDLKKTDKGSWAFAIRIGKDGKWGALSLNHACGGLVCFIKPDAFDCDPEVTKLVGGMVLTRGIFLYAENLDHFEITGISKNSNATFAVPVYKEP